MKGSGKLGGHVFTTTRTGATIRTSGSVRNPQSGFQEAVRNEFTKLTQDWRLLTNIQRDSWRNAEENFTRRNRFGDIVRLTGKNLYNSLNYQRSIIGLGRLLIAPEPQQLGENLVTGVVFSAIGGEITITGQFSAQGQYVVVATNVLSKGVEFVQNKTRVVIVKPGSTDGLSISDPSDIASAYSARFGGATIGDKLFIGTYAINEIGQRSAVSIIGVTVT